MPNHTLNYLSVTFSNENEEAVRALLLDPETEQFSYEALRPMPDVVRKTARGSKKGPDGVVMTSWYQDGEEQRPFTDEERAQLQAHGATDWYDWAYKNWGVKWDAYGPPEVSLTQDDERTEIEIEFQSPWGPPDVWFLALRAHLAKLEDPHMEAVLKYRLEDDPYYPHAL